MRAALVGSIYIRNGCLTNTRNLWKDISEGSFTTFPKVGCGNERALAAICTAGAVFSSRFLLLGFFGLLPKWFVTDGVTNKLLLQEGNAARNQCQLPIKTWITKVDLHEFICQTW